MNILYLVSPFLGSGVLDLAGIDVEAVRRGHRVQVVDASRTDLESVVYESLSADVAICRFANQPNAIEVATSVAETIPVVCTGPSIDTARNQVKTLRVLQERDIAIPATIIADKRTDPVRIVSELGAPVVCKTPLTCGGAGVWLVRTEAEMSAHLTKLDDDDLLVTQHFHSEANGEDVRLLVVGVRVVAAIRRVAANGDFRANLFQGARWYSYRPSDQERSLAVAAASAVGLDVAGVDILSTVEGPVVVEVNPKPGNVGMDGSAVAVVDLAEQKAKLHEPSRQTTLSNEQV